jgi:hypothetical protein
VVLQQNKAELIGLYAIARSGLKDKHKLLVKKTRSYGFALQKNADGERRRTRKSADNERARAEVRWCMLVRVLDLDEDILSV